MIGGFKRGSKSQIKYDKVMAVREKETIQKQQWFVCYLNTQQYSYESHNPKYIKIL